MLFISGGKFGERSLRSQSAFVRSYEELMQLTLDETIIINSIVPLDEDCLQINYTSAADTDECLPTTSLVHAAWTTAHGRLSLYSALDTVGENALYHETGKYNTEFSISLSFKFRVNTNLTCTSC